MKKVFLFSFGLLAAISSLLVSCEEAVGDDDAPISVGGVLDPNGHEYVDLGLPSGIKWATCNVGATEPWEYGGYYAWGETEEKNKYDWNTYKWGYLINVATSSQSEFVTKYCVDNEYNDGKGIFDNKIILDLEDDVAYLKWGGEWRIPTLKEQKELLDNCSWEWSTIKGVNGYKVTGVNGNSIFLPAAGICVGENIILINIYGNYISSTLHTDGVCTMTDGLEFSEETCTQYYVSRCNGRTVRPVCK